MLALHLFPVLYRLMHVPGDDPALARHLSETFVDDMDAAIREIGVSDVRVPRRMKELYRSFAGRIAAYKAGLEEGEGPLAAAIARNVFPDETSDGRAAKRALALARYLQRAVAAVAGADLDTLRRGSARFAPPEPAIEADEQR
jgi:cytochrome b pre-mRNA-processing protein 3